MRECADVPVVLTPSAGLLVAFLLGFNDFDNVVVLLTRHDVLQNQVLTILIELEMQSPSGSLVDVGPIDRFLVSGHPMQSCLWILPRAVTFVVFEFGERLQKLELVRVVWKNLVSFMDDAKLVKKALDFSHS